MNNHEEIKALAYKIAFSLPRESKPVYMAEAKQADVKELIYVINNEYHTGERFMFVYFDLWKDFSYTDLLDVLDKFFIQGSRNILSLEPVLSFFYTFLRIDLISVYAEKEVKEKQLQQDILELFAERPGQLYVTPDSFFFRLSEYNIAPDALKAIRKRWISQGATKAERIDPYQHAKFINNILLFNVLGPPPKSWTWVKNININKEGLLQ